MIPSGITVERHETQDVSWAFARCLPHPALREDVVGYTGYVEQAVAPVRRRELPSPRVPVIISFGDTIEVVGSDDPHNSGVQMTSFVAGFSDSYAVTEYIGRQRGVQIDFTPLGACRLLNLSGDDLSGAVIDLTDVLGRGASRLAERLSSAPDWPARFALLDAELCRLEDRAHAVDEAIDWAWRQLVQTNGQAPIGALAERIGWSRRHFAQRFRTHIGLGPKVTGRVLRFDRAASLLSTSRSISEVAAECGYADHSHLVREFQQLAGCPPSELQAERSG